MAVRVVAPDNLFPAASLPVNLNLLKTLRGREFSQMRTGQPLAFAVEVKRGDA